MHGQNHIKLQVEFHLTL